MRDFRLDIRKIYDNLADGISKELFEARLQYSLFGKRDFLSAVISKYAPAFEKGYKKICLYGAGAGAEAVFFTSTKHIYIFDNGMPISFIVDKYKAGTLGNLSIILLDDFLKMPDCKDYLLIVTCGKPELKKEIEVELSRCGLKFTFLYAFGTQYFDIFSLDDEEYFVDAGALDGESTRQFFELCPNGHSYVFEPSPEQLQITKDNLKNFMNIDFFPYGIWNENTALKFSTSEDDKGNARISEKGNIEVTVRKLDDVLADKKVTFIKMDIEGAELNALRGAERIVREQKPKLAICVYHKPEDIWEIPLLLLEYCAEYKFYLRHYMVGIYETVLYAVADGKGGKK